MNDEEWFEQLEEHLLESDSPSQSMQTGALLRLVRLARKGLAAEKLAVVADGAHHPTCSGMYDDDCTCGVLEALAEYEALEEA